MEPRLNASEAGSIAGLLAPLASEKSLLVLEGVIQGLSASEIASRFGVPRSSVHEYIAALVEAAYIGRNERGYVATELGLSAMTWLVRTAKPRLRGYQVLIDVGRDLRNLGAVGDSIHKLSMRTEEEEYVRGLQILRELEREWFRRMDEARDIFSPAS
jgi:hypothetical protein